MNFYKFFLLLWFIFALLDPADPIESGSNPDADPPPCGPPHSKWSNFRRRPNLWRPPEISLIPVRPWQSLSLLIGVLSKSGEHINYHRHCPMSVFIRMTSKLEANLGNQRMASVLYTRGEGKGRA